MKQNCRVCNQQPSKYKCPTCLIPFCSVPCNRSHKANGCTATVIKETPAPLLKDPSPAPRDQEEEDILLTEDQLVRLDHDAEVWRKVRDSRVRAAIARINNASDHAKTLRKEMEDPAFLELCDDILAALGMKNEDNTLNL